MYINDEFVVEVIMSILCNSECIFATPNDYCVNYTYEETHSITLEDLRKSLNDIIGGSHEKT